MLKKLNLKPLDIAGIVILLILLVCVRLFQEKLFYDPFLEFYQGENYVGKPLPLYSGYRLFFGLLLRYSINTILSTGVLWLFFKDRNIIKLTGVLYMAFFAVLIAAIFIILSANEPNLLLLFYVRRFLLQPLFLILFIPAFYYQKKAK